MTWTWPSTPRRPRSPPGPRHRPRTSRRAARHRERTRRARGRVGRGDRPGERQCHPDAEPPRGRPDRAAVSVPGRAVPRDQGRRRVCECGNAGLHASRAVRRGRRDRAVELAGVVGRPEDRARRRVRQHGGPQGVGGGSARSADARRDLQPGAASRCRQYRDRISEQRVRRTVGRAPASAEADVHRLDRRRPGDPHGIRRQGRVGLAGTRRGRAPRSCTPMWISTPLPTASSRPCGSRARASRAPPGRGCSHTRRSSTTWWRRWGRS